MLKIFRNVINCFLNGIGYGATTFLLFIAFNNIPNVTAFNVLSVLIISGLIGVLTLVFDLDRWAYFVELLIHFFGTFSLILLMMWLNHWLVAQNLLGFIISFLLIYLIILLTVELKISFDIKRVNNKLAERHKNKGN